MPDFLIDYPYPDSPSLVASEDGLRGLVAHRTDSTALWLPMREVLASAKALGYGITPK